MQLEKIITLANASVRLRFLALERSLRSAGCNLPLWVIPYNDNKFDLPENSFWWEVPEIIQWLSKNNAHPMMRKYQCLTEKNYQFVDSDVVFLSDPSKVLFQTQGFVASCGHWNNPGHTYTGESLTVLKKKSNLWQRSVFNAGQFACDRVLYSVAELKRQAEKYKDTCLLFPYNDQPGMNLLVNLTDVPVNNLTLPPFNMESTWAGDYTESDIIPDWASQAKPYLIHWAGCDITSDRGINKLFYQNLNPEEKVQFDLEEQRNEIRRKALRKKSFGSKLFRKLKKIIKILKEA